MFVCVKALGVASDDGDGVLVAPAVGDRVAGGRGRGVDRAPGKAVSGASVGSGPGVGTAIPGGRAGFEVVGESRLITCGVTTMIN